LRLSYDRRILLIALASAVPAAAVSLFILWTGGYAARVQWTLTLVIVGVWAWCALAVRRRVVVPLQTLANLLAAMRERDFSIRARAPRPRGMPPTDPLDAVMLEVNELASTLHDQRLGALEAGALLRTVMTEIDVAVFTFDSASLLRLVNRAGERLLRLSAADMLGRSAYDLGLAGCLDGATPRIEDVAFPGASGRWEVRRTTFREEGKPHQLLVLADVSRPLRDEERQAWQRLIRVIGHEINNSLAPIKSIAGSLATIVERDPPPLDWREDVQRGLAVIGSRSESLSRFMSAYARLAKLPPPKLAPLDVAGFVDRVATLEKAHHIQVQPGPRVVVQGDGDQLEQLLINLIRNAVDAVRETGGAVRVGWQRLQGSSPPTMELWVEDEGPGLSNTGNLFVPFFTTKPGGSGIGLVLSRQIAEAHGGSLLLENRDDRTGCRASLRIPIHAVLQATVEDVALTHG
jgi:nitrogen fixation/metabolism regulation signal transduction histidine kinase